MVSLLALLALFCAPASAQPMRQNGIPSNLTETSFTATSYSSAPVVYTSSINAGVSGLLSMCGNSGPCIFKMDADGADTGIRVNGKDLSAAIDYPLEVVGDPTGYAPMAVFRRNDTSVTAGDYMGEVTVRDNDSSTGGSSIKSYMRVTAQGLWTSGNAMETQFEWGLSRGGGAAANYAVLSSTGLAISGGTGLGSVSACSTCTLQVISPAGAGADISGNLAVSGATKLGIRTKAQLDAITPVIGDQYLCSDCTVTYDHCVGTAATLSGFRATINSAINTAIPGTLVSKGCGTNN